MRNMFGIKISKRFKQYTSTKALSKQSGVLFRNAQVVFLNQTKDATLSESSRTNRFSDRLAFFKRKIENPNRSYYFKSIQLA